MNRKNSCETNIYLPLLFPLDNMAKKQGAGFQSAAGLIRYFDSEDDKALKINPWLVIAMCVASAVIVSVAAVVWPV